MSLETVDVFDERYNGFKIVFTIRLSHDQVYFSNDDSNSTALNAQVEVYDTVFFGLVTSGRALFQTTGDEWVESDDELDEQIEQLRDEAQTFADSIAEARSIGKNRGGARAVYK